MANPIIQALKDAVSSRRDHEKRIATARRNLTRALAAVGREEKRRGK